MIADRRLLVHALVNLLKNAVEAATVAGISPTIRLEAGRVGSFVRVSVRDNGPGLASDAPARIFDSGYSTKGPGRGRGLSIVRESDLRPRRPHPLEQYPRRGGRVCHRTEGGGREPSTSQYVIIIEINPKKTVFPPADARTRTYDAGNR